MDGASHYRQAEMLLANACSETAADGTPVYDPDLDHVIAAAHVHATLAVAAEKRKPLVVYVGGTVDPEALANVADQVRKALDEGGE